MRSALPSSLVRHSVARQSLRQQRGAASKRFATSSSGSSNDPLAAAQKAAGRLWEGSQKLLGPMGEKIGNLLGCKFYSCAFLALNTRFGLLSYCFRCCQLYKEKLIASVSSAYRQPLFYNFAVTRELLKQVYIKEGLQPPSFATIREAYASIWSQVTNPGFLGNLIKSEEVGRVGIYGLQAYGVFKVRRTYFA